MTRTMCRHYRETMSFLFELCTLTGQINHRRNKMTLHVFYQQYVNAYSLNYKNILHELNESWHIKTTASTFSCSPNVYRKTTVRARGE